MAFCASRSFALFFANCSGLSLATQREPVADVRRFFPAEEDDAVPSFVTAARDDEVVGSGGIGTGG